ncbi:regulation of nuclear pre-mRNA domain-containing protein 2 [Bombina bombina]|uniref:regulation of nuclear pre-mRNA domain-containing protein 2 n=1 Tax=Bombina bombina TaxID=8345 RepID=UPI00235ABE82|nr:regulation of nuclear pre-mRNA domain-containing protein 2 [Bombina bombina]
MTGTDSASTASTTVISPPTQTTASALIPSSITISTHVPVSSNISVPVPTTSTPAKNVNTSTITPSIPLALPNLANVDLGKISSILSSLTSVMKTTGVSPAAKPSPGTPTTPTTNLSGSLKTPVQGAPNPLANILSKVEITPESILSVLSKSQGPTTPSIQGLSLFQNATENTVVSSATVTNSNSTASINSTVSAIKDNDSSSDTPPYASKNFAYSPATSSSEVPSSSVFKTTAETSSNLKQTVNPLEFSSQTVQSTENAITQLPELSKPNDEAQPSSLEMKIHNFLKGNPGFSGLDLNIPILSGLGANAVAETPEFNRGLPSSSLDNVDGTPVRDERSGTPTQDEIMDKPSSNVDTLSLISKIISPGSSTPSSTRSPLLNKDSDFQKPGSMPTYRSFGLSGNSPNAYTETMDKTPSFIDSPITKFYPETTFQEDGDYRDFDYSVPPPTTSVSLENNPTKSNLKSNQGLGASEYPPNISGFSQSQDFGRHSFPSSMQASFNPGEASDQLSPSSEMFGRYSLMGGDMEPSRSSPSKGDLFFPPDNINHSLSLLHSGISQSQYQESPHSQTQSLNFSTKTNVPDLPQGLGNWKEEQPLCSTVSVSSTIEFKNMLKNASRRPSDENHFSQTNPDNLNEEVKVSALDSTQISSEEQQQQEEHFHIETRVSSDCADLPDNKEEKGAPIETLGYHNSGNINLSGEPIKTVESMRVGNRGHGRGGSRVGWFEIGSTGSSFDDLSGGSEQTSVSTSSSRVGFETPPEELLPRYSDALSDFRGNKMQSFEHRLPPPPIVASMERSGNFPNEQTGPPPGPPPNLPPDHGSLFPRDHPVPSHMNSVEPPNSLTHGSRSRPMDHGGTPFPMHPPPDLGGIPFSPQSVDIRNPFSQDHNIIHQGSMREHFGLLPVPARDHGVPSIDHNGPPLGRVNETLPLHSRDPHSSHGAPPPPLIAHHHRDNTNRGGFRQPRPNFRPREPYHNLKRPRPPFGRGPHFFAPKRPFYPPRY